MSARMATRTDFRMRNLRFLVFCFARSIDLIGCDVNTDFVQR